MPAKETRWWAGLLSIVLLAPAGATGRLCAAAPPNTSAPPCTITLLLPLHSAQLAAPAQAVRDGFLAAASLDEHKPAIDVRDSGEQPAAVQAAYAAAAIRSALVVGPIGKSLVQAILASPAAVPTLVLSLPNEATLPPRMAAIGLSPEDEARQLVQWAASRHKGHALVVSTGASWQKRQAGMLAGQWQQGGRTASLFEAASASGYLTDAALAALVQKLASDKPALVFAALEPDQARQLKAALPPELPVYASSSVNPGRAAQLGPQELDGLRLLDLPWLLAPDPAMPEPLEPLTPDLARLYALGIDAYRLARALVLDGGDVALQGVSGHLRLRFGEGPAQFERRTAPLVFQGGQPQLVREP